MITAKSFLPRQRRSFASLSAAALLALATACGTSTEDVSFVASKSACQAGTAEIGVYETFLTRICGCAEASHTNIQPPAALTCTITAGTSVAFIYLAPYSTHQIVSSGTPSFQPSPPNTNAASHVVSFSSSGTYSFKDLYNATMSGQIIVP